MSYSVGNVAPFFKNGQEARAYALANPSLAIPCEIGGPGTTSSMVFCEGSPAGEVMFPPAGALSVEEAFWKPYGESTLYPLAEDGSYDPDDIHQVCLEPTVWLRPRLTNPTDGSSRNFFATPLPFENQEKACRWFVEKTVPGMDSPLLDADENELGVLVKIVHEGSEKTILFTRGKCREICPTGRIGKPFDAFAFRRALIAKRGELMDQKRALERKIHAIESITTNGEGVE